MLELWGNAVRVAPETRAATRKQHADRTLNRTGLPPQRAGKGINRAAICVAEYSADPCASLAMAMPTLLRFSPAALLLQPGSEIGLLLLFQVHAVGDEFQRLLQGALRRRDGVLAEKVLHLLLVPRVTEAARAIHHRTSRKVGQLGFHLAPVLAYPVPGLVLGIGIAHEPPDKEGCVLRAHLGGDGILQAALDQSRFLEVTQRAQKAKGFFGRPGGLRALLDGVVKGGIAVAGSDIQSGIEKRWVHRLAAQRLFRELAGELGQLRIVAYFAHQGQQVSAAGALLFAVIGLRRPAQLFAHGTERLPHPGFVLLAVGAGGQMLVNVLQFLGKFVGYRASWVIFQ